MGFQNIVPSDGIPIDTWQNLDFNDPSFDHIGIYKNGDLVNGTPNTPADPVPALAPAVISKIVSGIPCVLSGTLLPKPFPLKWITCFG
jgi:hypothetical protein